MGVSSTLNATISLKKTAVRNVDPTLPPCPLNLTPSGITLYSDHRNDRKEFKVVLLVFHTIKFYIFNDLNMQKRKQDAIDKKEENIPT